MVPPQAATSNIAAIRQVAFFIFFCIAFGASFLCLGFYDFFMALSTQS
jgi:hypothetical protein